MGLSRRPGLGQTGPVDRHIPFERLHNVRDLGGYRAGGGTVRWGRLYRADNLAKLRDEPDLARFRALKIRTVVDLRYDWELAGGRMPEFDGVDWRNVCLEHRTYDQATNAPDVDPVEFFAGKHGELADDSGAELREILEIFVEPEAAPVMFHCKTGKDRTGFVAAMTLALLGVDDADIAADYALTNRATAKFVADWAGPEPIRWPAYGTAPAESITLFLARLRAEHGSVGAWAAGWGIDDGLVTALRKELVEPA